MTETGLFAGADITLELLIQQPAPALVPIIVRPDLTCRLPDLQMTNSASDVCEFHFWVSNKEDSVRKAVPMIARPGFSMSCEIIWISHSGNTEVGAHPNETVGCVQGSVNKGV